MIATRTAAKALPRYWGRCKGSRDLHRFRYGATTALCGLRLAPGAALTDDPSVVTRPCRLCAGAVEKALEENR